MADKSTGLSARGSFSDIDIVIVNWNSRSYLSECLAALDQSTMAESIHVVIVDNASTDGSAERLEAERTSLGIVRNADNRGFAAACNQGARRGSAPLLLFLNPDVIVRADTVAKAARYMKDPTNSNVGCLGIQLLDEDRKVRCSCARTPTVATLLLRTLFLDRLFPALVPPHFLEEWDHGDTRPVEQVMGAFLMIRRALFERLGGFDERFFLYYEDVDLCLAVRQDGWSVVHFTGAQAEHSGQGTTRAIKDRRLFHLAASRVDYTAKRHGRIAAIVLMVFILSFELPIRWFHATITRSPRESWFVLRGAALFWQNLSRLCHRIAARR